MTAMPKRQNKHYHDFSIITYWLLYYPKHKDTKNFVNHLNPVLLIFIRLALTEYSQMSAHVAGFQSFFSFFASLCIGQIGHQLHKD